MAQVYLALLRGINVGGRNKIAMAELRERLVAWGIPDARTYIQSGNVLFTSAEREEVLRERLEAGIAEHWGFPVAVVLRTAEELAQMVAACPYAPDTLAEGESLYAALLATAPDPAKAASLALPPNTPDECALVGRDAYLLYRQPYHESKMTNAWLERALGVASTTRNWRTLTTLNAMLAEMLAP